MIRSLRQTVAQIDMDIAYRWFQHCDIDTPVPHFATVSYAFETRCPSELIEAIFAWVLEAAVERRLVEAKRVFTDATHIKTIANVKKYRKVLAEKTARVYDEQLRKEIETDRTAHGKKPLKDECYMADRFGARTETEASVEESLGSIIKELSKEAPVPEFEESSEPFLREGDEVKPVMPPVSVRAARADGDCLNWGLIIGQLLIRFDHLDLRLAE